MVFVTILVLGGYFAPLAIYETKHGCPTTPTPEVHLHMIKGDSIEKIKASDTTPTDPTVGCAPNTKYTLYLL